MQNKKLIMTIILVVVVGVGAFFGGTVYEKDKLSSQGLLRSANIQGANGGQRRGSGQEQGGGGAGFAGVRGNGGNANGGFVAGDIISKDDRGITIKTSDGGSKIVFFSDITKIAKTTDGSSADLQIGKNATVAGNSNSDGSITANSIQLQPAVPFQQ